MFIKIAALVLLTANAEDFTQYGVDQNHSSAFKTNLIKNISSLKASRFDPLSKSTVAAPLFFNETVFWGDTDGLAHFKNMTSGKFHWSLDLDKSKISSTPIYLRAFKKIYFLTTLRNKTGFRTFLNSVDESGLNYTRFEIDHTKFLSTKTPVHPNQLLHCKTALSYDGRALNFGCSMYSNAKEGFRNRAARGISGILYSAPLDNQGRIATAKLTAFVPSVVDAKNAETGFDTGIWQTGASPLPLKDGTLLVSTGNGPVFPEQGNYGCALLRLDPSRKKILNSLFGDEGRYKECEFNSLDFSSSSPVLLEDVAFTSSKGGLLVAFNPYNFSNKKLYFRTRFSARAYGQPLAWREGKNLFAVASGYDKSEPLPPVTFLAPESFAQNIGDYKKFKCVGYLKKGKDKSKKLSLFYSGPKMDEYLISNLPKEKILFERRTYFKNALVFYWEKASPDLLLKHNLKNSTAKLLAYKETGKESEDDAHIGIQMWSEESKRDGLDYEAVSNLKDSFDFYTTTDPAKNYVKEIDGMEKLWLFWKEPKPYKPELNLIGLTLNEKRKASIRFEKNYPYMRPHNSNPALLINDSNPAQKLWLLTVYNPSEKGGGEAESKALFIDPANGEIKKEVPFKGIPKFAMPVVYKDRIFISTMDAGTVVIQ